MLRNNIAIITSYNDMLSAHQPYEHYPEIIRKALHEANATIKRGNRLVVLNCTRLLDVQRLLVVSKLAFQFIHFITKQNGMFSFSGLTKEQVLRLREEFGVYAVASGRVNVAGMTPDNMAPLCEAIVAVL